MKVFHTSVHLSLHSFYLSLSQSRKHTHLFKPDARRSNLLMNKLAPGAVCYFVKFRLNLKKKKHGSVAVILQELETSRGLFSHSTGFLMKNKHSSQPTGQTLVCVCDRECQQQINGVWDNYKIECVCLSV